ncbi:cytochrome P450 [Fomes fomentarius]|nr:cytochrome P450 [Fomes fomentarius]
MVATILAGLIGLSLLCLAIYRLWLSPLAPLPGSTLCALTRLPLMHHEFTAQRSIFIHALHLKYGPVVRVAPNEVSFASREAVKEVYASGGSGYDKSNFYHLFSNFNTPNMFSTLEKGQHADMKKRFAERYSKSHVMKPDVVATVKEHVDAFVVKVSDDPVSSQDIYVLLHCYALDGITGHLFYPSGLHSLTDPDDYKIMQELSYSNPLRLDYFRHYFPILSRICSKLSGKSAIRTTNLASSYVLNNTRDGTVASHTVLSKLRIAMARGQDSAPETETDINIKVAASECMDHLVAGIDTTGDGLCFLMHHLSLPIASSQRIQERLHAELIANPSATIDDLPYLDAVVKEGLRVYCPIPMSLPRIVPAGGRTVDGVRLPAGTIVSCQPYTLHRLDEKVFPDPEEFVPERWLDPEGATERNQLFFAFASGGRGCIGKHLAMLEMKLLLREVYSTYRTRVAPEMKASMDPDDQTMSTRPKDQSCLIVFEKFEDVL